jgi:hypothetical protein
MWELSDVFGIPREGEEFIEYEIEYEPVPGFMTGKKHTEESKRQMSESKKGRRNINGLSIPVEYEGIQYSSIRELSEVMGVSQQTMSRRLGRTSYRLNPHYHHGYKLVFMNGKFYGSIQDCKKKEKIGYKRVMEEGHIIDISPVEIERTRCKEVEKVNK